ncbi:Glutamate receptor 2 [Bulinus truncatus]|nr:Glutamate receptor 2 [Bulinus truncatus]
MGHNQVHITLVLLYQFNSAHEDLKRVDVIGGNEEKFIVIDVTNRTALSSLIRQIAEVGMNREGYNYLLASLDALTLDLSQLRHGGATVYSFQVVDFDNSQAKSLQLTWKSLEPQIWPGAGTDMITSEVALSMDAVELIKRSITALTDSKKDVFQFTFRRGNVYNINSTIGLKCGSQPIQPWMHGDDLYNALMKVNFEGVTGNIQFDRNGRRYNYSINIIAVSAGSKPKKPPFLMLRSQLETDGLPPLDNNRFEGYTKDLADEISDHLHIQYVLKVVENGECGKNLGNGSWTGMIGRLIDRTADLAIGPMTISLEREKVVDFSMSFMKSGISALLHQPAKVKPNMFSFMEPFSLSLWLSILLACIGVSLVLFIVHCLQADPLEADKVEATLKNSFWFILSSLLSQGSDIFLSSPASRILGGTWWFFVLILLSSYTANLAAFLTIDRIQRPIKSLEDLLAQNEISYGTIENGFPREFFEVVHSTNILGYKQLWETMSESYQKVMVNSVEEGLQRIQTARGKYALLLESSFAEYYKNRKPCNTIEIMSSFNHKGFGIATQSRSVLTYEERNEALKTPKRDLLLI